MHPVSDRVNLRENKFESCQLTFDADVSLEKAVIWKSPRGLITLSHELDLLLILVAKWCCLIICLVFALTGS